MRHLRKLLVALALLVFALLVLRFGNTVLIRVEPGLESQSFGTTDDGRLLNGKRLPTRGPNFVTYSYLGSLIGRNCVHSRVRATIIDAFAALHGEMPEVRFVVAESSWPTGGPLRPHKTHQNGLSVDFMVPVRDSERRPEVLTTGFWNKWGYALEFDSEGRRGDLRIDFAALAAHLWHLAEAGPEHGVVVARVIFDPELQPRLWATEHGPRIRDAMRFSQRRAWVRHDEHYHVDFGFR
jgi:penicillin-insensitive murein endopeptidase